MIGTVEERFSRFVLPEPNSGCYLWIGTWVSGKLRPAAQVAWELEHGEPFPDGKDACHHCDNPPCVRGDHVFPGTPSENARDALRKGRLVARRGFRDPKSFWTKCKSGHAFTEDGPRSRSTGQRICRECRRRYQRDSAARLRASGKEIARPR